jgi:hypothetical protein
LQWLTKSTNRIISTIFAKSRLFSVLLRADRKSDAAIGWPSWLSIRTKLIGFEGNMAKKGRKPKAYITSEGKTIPDLARDTCCNAVKMSSG